LVPKLTERQACSLEAVLYAADSLEFAKFLDERAVPKNIFQKVEMGH